MSRWINISKDRLEYIADDMVNAKFGVVFFSMEITMYNDWSERQKY